MRTYTITTDKTLDAQTDRMLRNYIIDLADKCIAVNYEGPECRLATFLAEFIYQCSPVDLRPKKLDEAHRVIMELTIEENEEMGKASRWPN